MLTPELQDRICNYIRAGMFETTAVGACGISPTTFREWIRRGSDTDRRSTSSQFAQFATAVRLARAEARGAAEIEVRQKDPKFWLTHADPEWAEVKRLEITGRDGRIKTTGRGGGPDELAPPLTAKQERELEIETRRIMRELGIIEDKRVNDVNTCPFCGRVVKGVGVDSTDGKRYHPECSANRPEMLPPPKPTLVLCTKCHREIVGAFATPSSGGRYHAACTVGL